MIIDFHTHAYPDAVAQNALAHMRSLAHCTFYTDGTVSNLTASMTEAEIGYSVVLPVVTNPAKACSINNISIANTRKNGLIYFGGIHPDTENYRQELDRLALAGIKGIKLHPQYQGTPIDDIRYLHIMEYTAKLGLIVVIHAGEECAFPGLDLCNPEMIRRVLQQVDGITLVAAHMGGVYYWDRVAENLLDTDVYLDTSCILAPLKREKTNEEFNLMKKETFMLLVQQFGAERILFGSDSPWTSQKSSVDTFLSLPLSEEDKACILYQNACRLLGI